MNVIPTIKTLIIYKPLGVGESKAVLTDFLTNDEEFYVVENKIEELNPFTIDFEKSFNFECHERDKGVYRLELHNRGASISNSIVSFVDVWLEYVVEFKGKVFGLNKVVHSYLTEDEIIDKRCDSLGHS